jgi:hypothetical protein
MYFILIIILIKINTKYYIKIIKKEKGTKELKRLKSNIILLSKKLKRERVLRNKYKKLFI